MNPDQEYPPDQSQNTDDIPPVEFDTSFFPAPSPYFHRYTSTNLALPPTELISDVPNEPQPFLAKDLEPPNVEWIVEEGSYSVFGETWPVNEQLPSLTEMGVKEMFDTKKDRKVSLQTLLRTLLLTYTQLLNSLLTPPPSLLHPQPAAPPPPPNPDGSQPPPPASQAVTDPERLTEHVRLISINMHHLVNELRPVQARETLKLMMRYQIDRRKEKTMAIKQRCQEIESTLSSLQSHIQETSESILPSQTASLDQASAATKASTANEHGASIRDQLAKMVDDL